VEDRRGFEKERGSRKVRKEEGGRGCFLLVVFDFFFPSFLSLTHSYRRKRTDTNLECLQVLTT
jgi:hypothetical protein